MSGRPQCRPRSAWRSTPAAALCPALAVLLMALVMCLGSVARSAGDHAPAHMTAMSAVRTSPEGPAEHHALRVTHPGHCPTGDMCCAQDTQAARAVLPATAQPVPGVLPRNPSLPGPATLACALGLTPTRGAPDLHVLQVQRT
ncbi:hypothetical protein ACIQB5_38555 [Streptomyces sp. NPDC088560]|uniref:hypothetical protein n=1 Tax=Streptomyces sp. NPDC088560 TaxID=3365868 RepID=UPI0037F47334